MPIAKKYSVTMLTSADKVTEKVIKNLNRDGATKVVEVLQLGGNVQATFLAESRRKIKKAVFGFARRNANELVALEIEELP